MLVLNNLTDGVFVSVPVVILFLWDSGGHSGGDSGGHLRSDKEA